MHLGPVGGGVGAALFFVGARENGEHGGVEKHWALGLERGGAELAATNENVQRALERIADFASVGGRDKDIELDVRHATSLTKGLRWVA